MISKEELIQLRDLATKMLESLNEESATNTETEPIQEKVKRGRPKKVQVQETTKKVRKNKKVKQTPQKPPKASDVLPTYSEEEVDEREFVGRNQHFVEKGTEARVESMNLTKNRPNLFDKLVQRSDIKREVERETNKAKFLHDNIDPTPRGERESGLVELNCNKCGRVFEVSVSLIHDWKRWKCNNCSKYSG